LFTPFLKYFKKNKKIAKKPKNNVIDVLAPPTTSFSMCLVVNVLFKSTLMSLFFKKIQNTKIRKIKIYK